jgi:effector-binding domain-containing protein
MQYLEELKENPIGAPFVIYYNMDMQDLDIEIGFPVSKNLPDKDKIKSSEITAGKFASCLYTGPYTEISLAYDALTKWVEDNEYKTTGIAIETYLNDPREIPPEELKTEIEFLLK